MASSWSDAPFANARASLLPSVILASLVLVLVHAVESGATLRSDRALLVALRRPGAPEQPIGPDWLLGTMRDMTSLGSTTVTLLILAVAVLAAFLQRRWRNAALLLLAVGGGTGLVNVVKSVVARIRPDVVPHLTTELTFSFPSSHSAMSVLTYGAIATIASRSLPKLRGLAVATACGLALTIGVSRLYLGVHYPSDVVAGWLFGTMWLLVCQKIPLHTA